MSFDTPIAFFIYNRPDVTNNTYREISRIKPSKLFIIADGPRSNGDVKNCEETRAIVDTIDWECDIYKNFSDANLGCKSRISSGLDWVFDMCEEAIILEDDCVPDQSFFRYCSELLNYYRDEHLVGVISGDNFQFGNIRSEYSYYFSNYVHVWGWATWRRVWKHYDASMRAWPIKRKTKLLDEILENVAATNYWKDIFDKTYSGMIDTWDYQLLFTCWSKRMLTILPNVNLVSNIGFGKFATHTIDSSGFANLPTRPIDFPINHPKVIRKDREADHFTFTNHYKAQTNSILSRIKKRIRSSIEH